MEKNSKENVIDKLRDDEYFNQLSRERFTHSLGRKILPISFNTSVKQNELLFWLMQSDLGVRLNRGKFGSKDGARVLVHHLSNMTLNPEIDRLVLNIFTHEDKTISDPLDLFVPNSKLWGRSIVQLGGGHDHVYHLLNLAFLNGVKKFYIINLDAHADMRKDKLLHSGTPFRLFYEQRKNEIKTYHLEQWGLNKFSQNVWDLELKGAEIHSLWMDQCSKKNIFDRIQKLQNLLKINFNHKDTMLLISLDTDVMNSSQVKAVSAVNAQGFYVHQLRTIISQIAKNLNQYHPNFGVYEYNPLFDDVQASSAKTIASLIYQWIAECHSKSS